MKPGYIEIPNHLIQDPGENKFTDHKLFLNLAIYLTHIENTSFDWKKVNKTGSIEF